MLFDAPLIPGRLIRRYKRFLADVRLEDGEELTVHVANPGAMTSCLGTDWPVLLHDSKNPKRKLSHSLEMLHNGQCWIGVHTQRSNKVAEEAIRKGLVPEVGEFSDLKSEVPYGKNSRVDWLATGPRGRCWIEVKHVSLRTEDGLAAFPDSVTTRGLKHLKDLVHEVASGDRAVLILLVQRGDVDSFRPAVEIDPEWSKELEYSLSKGLELAVVQVDVRPEGLFPKRRLPYTLK